MPSHVSEIFATVFLYFSVLCVPGLILRWTLEMADGKEG